MGQVALGLKNLALRIVVFVIMAAVLAWALGGTLFPAAHRVHLEAWDFDGASWNWRVSGNGAVAGPASWTLFERRDGSMQERRFGIPGHWRHVWGPIMRAEELTLGVESQERDGAMQSWMVRLRAAPTREVQLRSFPGRAELLKALAAVSEIPASTDLIDGPTTPAP